MKLIGYLSFLFIFNATAANEEISNETKSACDLSIQSGDYSNALEVCNNTLRQGQTDTQTTLSVYLQLTTIHHELGNKEDESYYLAKIKSHPGFLEDIRIQYEWHRKVGQKYYLASDYKLASKHLSQALKIAKNENQALWISKSHNDVGLVELKLENFKSALQHYQQSLILKKQHGNKYQIAKTLNNLGLIHYKLEMFPEATSYYEDALSHYLSYTEKGGFDERVFYDIAHIYEDLSRAHSANNDSQKADEYTQAVLDSLKLKISPHEQARALFNIAKWHHTKNNFKFSQLFLNEASELLTNEDNNELLAHLNLLRSQVSWKMGATSLAEEAAVNGLELAKTLHNDQLITDYYHQIGIIYEASDPSKALKATQQYQAYRELFLKKKYDSDLRSVQHEIEKQQIEQRLLNQKLTNTEQQHQLQQQANIILWVLIFLVLVIAILIIYHLKKKKEKEGLVKAIHYHKQQLLLLEATQNQSEALPQSNDPSHLKTQLKNQLVTTMIDAVNIWEKNTQSNQIELAEQSKIWTVSIDNGTLRTRSLDKYLSLDKIPQNPRWRNVVKTCHFILSHDQLSGQDRTQLNHHLEQIMETVRNLSLSHS